MSKAISRRSFLKCAGAASLAVAASGVLSACTTKVQTVKINYFCEEEYRQVYEEVLVVPADAETVNTSAFKEIPDGYKLVESGELPIRDGYVYAQVVAEASEPTTQEVHVNYYSRTEGKMVGTEVLTVDASVKSILVSQLTTIPEGYELEDEVWNKECSINDGWVQFVVEKEAGEETETIEVVYYDFGNSKSAGSEYLEVPVGSTYVNTSKLTVPAGYELEEVGDLAIRNGYVNAAVRKLA